ncbi:FAD/NAD(P)-binding domain-containing protein [Pseudovirgaria hyperparasitica]|uniref:FAD/NAD(P)-binding domain-containing protein n=1 Tax=Pseudovirgaria hyperparasitica TaxID=470096 RepID=A0A6A6W2Z4_9PEZI|nr:FAD/NAD(P)-binding domain-containing protein [Pseudovirgaria hyperparasitica]KAF2756384.1 FAD/NAD(P)-binding domain-containing protein [Pseudovirgaria hyperparasitica]
MTVITCTASVSNERGDIETPTPVTNRVNGIKDINGHKAASISASLVVAEPGNDEAVASYPRSNLRLDEDHHIDDIRPLRAVVIGAGLSGILAGILLPAKVPKLELTIIEKNDDVGGTWLENIYPGVRCDIPAHVYQATFSPNTQWSQQFAEGHEILAYWKEQARKYDVYRKVQFRRQVVDLAWDDRSSHWIVKARDTVTGTIHEQTADFVLPALGRFNTWKLPEYPGIQDYKGHLRHTSNWDPEFDPKGKRVAVIGNGASGIQVVPNMQLVAAHVDHYARNKTWIAGSWAGDARTFEPQWFSEQQLKEFEDPEKYLEFRKALEDKYWRRFPATFRGSKENKGLREAFIEIMKGRVTKKPELIENLIPDFNPNCRRLTPGPGYLEALTEPNVDFIQTPIKRFTETGIETADGIERPVDAILCATGAHVDFLPRFPITAHGRDLRDLWRPGGEHGWPYTYMGLATPSFPNLLFIHGPHGAGPAGTVPHSVEVQVVYYAKLLRKVSSQGIKTITPSKKATDDFVEYADAFFPKTVLTDNCSSWANGGKAGQRIHGHWPGSAAHATIVRREPRWEDWEYEYISNSGNRFAYFGNGFTKRETDAEYDMTPYLKLPADVDLRDLHEQWHELP